MDELVVGLVGTSRKPHERRRAVHPEHMDRVDPAVASSMLVEEGYGEPFGVPDAELATHVAGLVPREELFARSDVLLLAKPVAEDVAAMRDGQVLWGWPHLVQDPELTQLAIDRRLTVIAWEAMNHWGSDGSYDLHVFHQSNEIAGYAAVMHALQLRGRTGAYGRRLRAAVISFGATARGAVRALNALGVTDVEVLTQRDTPAVAAPFQSTVMGQFERLEDDPSRTRVLRRAGPQPMHEFLAEHDVVVNCVLQDPERPLLFVDEEQLASLAPGTIVVDVSVDPGMAFSWSGATTFDDPVREVGDRVHYYAVDHTPSLLWDASTWAISEALLPHLPVVAAGPDAWDGSETVRRAIEVRDGHVVNPKVLSFQDRDDAYPHERRG